jgi:hypothetical protein
VEQNFNQEQDALKNLKASINSSQSLMNSQTAALARLEQNVAALALDGQHIINNVIDYHWLFRQASRHFQNLMTHDSAMSFNVTSIIRLPTHHLGGVDGAHLVMPRRGWVDAPDDARLVERVAGDADVVIALEHRLDVANLERRVRAELGKLAGRGDDVVDELVGELKEGL